MTSAGMARRTLVAVLAAVVLVVGIVAAAEAAVLGRGQAEDEGTDDEGADLDEAISRPVNFDIDSVFADLGPIGDFSGIYEYGQERITNVARRLSAFTPLDERETAERFLLDHRCSGVLALATRQQATRPVFATVFRTDFDGTGAPRVDRVRIGSVTVSVLDFSLLQARPPAVIEELVAGDAAVAEELDGRSVADALESDPAALYRGAWRSCLRAAAERGSSPTTTTIRGEETMYATLDRPAALEPDVVESGADVVTWLEEEPALDVRVQMSFDDVPARGGGSAALALDTRRFLQVFANPVEPALEVGARILARDHDDLAVLRDEAFAPVPGFDYGEEIAGVDEAVRSALRRSTGFVDGATLEEVTGEEGDLSSRVRAVAARPLFEDGVVRENLEARFSVPPRAPADAATAIVQVVFWDRDLLNSEAFRAGWRRGLARDSSTSVGLEQVVSPRELEELRRSDLVVDAVYAEHDGFPRLHYLTPCSSVTISAFEPSGIADVVQGVVDAQISARDRIFGALPVGADGEAAPRGLVAPALDDLVSAGTDAAGVVGEAPVDDSDEARAERAAVDRVRAARCSSNNLVEARSGLPFVDADRNGIHDDVPENDAASSSGS